MSRLHVMNQSAINNILRPGDLWFRNRQGAAPILLSVIPDISGTNLVAITPYDASVHFQSFTTLSYALNGAPSAIVIDAATGIISGTPALAGTTSATVTATNAAGSVTSNTFDFIIA